MRPQIVVFDLGGVLVKLTGVGEFAALLGGLDEAQVWATWLGSESCGALNGAFAIRTCSRGKS